MQQSSRRPWYRNNTLIVVVFLLLLGVGNWAWMIWWGGHWIRETREWHLG